MTGYDEALAWFRADPERMQDLDEVDNRSAVIAIVRALLAAPPTVPAGRDLTAADRSERHGSEGEQDVRIEYPDRSPSLPAASPDDAPADEHTETATQYVVMTTRPDGEVQKIAHEGRERAIEIAQSWRAPEGWGPAWVECTRTVSTTTRTTDWKADES